MNSLGFDPHTTVPNIRPILAVSAIANAPQNVTRASFAIVAGQPAAQEPIDTALDANFGKLILFAKFSLKSLRSRARPPAQCRTKS